MLSLDDTIAAIASASGSAARGLVRLSGGNVLEVVSRCFRPNDRTVGFSDIETPTAVEGHVCGPQTADPVNSLQIPATLFLWPTTRSYTRQPMGEFHTIGSPPLLDLLLRTLCTAGARLAQPGEFTLRAFLAGRIDLTQAEAVLGVVDAADRRQLDVALAQLAGGLSKPLQQLRDDLLNLLADLEAGLDFVEEDIRFVEKQELDTRLANAASQLDELQQQLHERSDANRLPRVVLIGWPNVGKSSLFNALASKAAALVSPQAGTTRDYLSMHVRCNELEIELIDTAGIDANEQTLPIDQAAQAAAVGQHWQADLRVLCLDISRPMNAWEREKLANENTLVAWTKCDLPTEKMNLHNKKAELAFASDSSKAPLRDAVFTSSRNGEGLLKLQTAIAAALLRQPSESSGVVGTAARARESILLASNSIADARQLAQATEGEEFIAAEIRTALTELGKVVGAVYTDDLLDRIFSRFCIGK